MLYIVFERTLKLIKQHGLTIKELQEILGFEKTALYKWNSPKIPQPDKLIKVADYFHVTVDYLVGRTDSPYPDDSAFQDKAEIIEVLETMSLTELDEQAIIDQLKTFYSYVDKKRAKENQISESE